VPAVPRVLFVSKPIAPPFHDGTKCLVRDVAAELERVTPVVLTTRAGISKLPAGVSGRAVYAEPGAFSPALLGNARATLGLLAGPRDDLWHFVFAPNARTGRVARALSAIKRQPVVQTVASPPREFSNLKQLLFGDHVVVQSRATLRGLTDAAIREGFTLPPLSVVPPPVSRLAPPSPDQIARARAELGIDASSRIVLYPGDLEVSSGAEVTRALVTPLCRRFPDVVVVLSYRNKTPRAAVRARELKAALAGLPVRITDRVSSMISLLAASRVVLFPVDDLWGKVDQPIVLLEALALGVPCVVLDRGPLCDIRAAVKLPTLELGAWLDAVAALEEPSLRERVIAEGRAAASSVYDPRVVAQSYERIYLELMGAAKRRS
jgi:phosphatidylinositol alpha-1,6-mannosyltransferase